MNRRRFLATALTSSAAAAAAPAFGQFLNAPRHGLPGTLADRYAKLDAILQQPVFKRELFQAPVIIQSIELLTRDKQYICRVRSKDGHEGIAVAWEELDRLDDDGVLEELALEDGLLEDGVELGVAVGEGAGEAVARGVEELAEGGSGGGGGAAGQSGGEEATAVHGVNLSEKVSGSEGIPWQTSDSAHLHRLPLHRTCNSIAGTLAHAWRMDGSADCVVGICRGRWLMPIDRSGLPNS